MVYAPNFPEAQGRDILARAGLTGEVYAPTVLAYEKDYFDAVAPVRDFLADNGIHDFDTQELGLENRVVRTCVLCGPHHSVQTEVAFLRQARGDRRVRISALSEIAEPNDLLALVAVAEDLFVLNLSDQTTRENLFDDQSALRMLLHSPQEAARPSGHAKLVRAAADRVLRQIWARLGQPAFRKRLMSAYASTCAITGCRVAEVLEAAHITPFASSLDHSEANGLLLRADIHTLFDLHLLSVTHDGTIHVSPTLMGSEYAAYDQVQAAWPTDARLRPSPEHLREHNESCDWTVLPR